MAKANGTDIGLSIAGNWLSAQTDLSISMAADMLDATTKDSTGAAKEYLAGETGGTMNASGLWDPSDSANVKEIIAALKARAAVACIWGEGTGTGDIILSCQGFVSGYSINGPKNDLASYTIDIQITGALTQSTA
jgi:predicted secreted protein